MSMMQQQRIPAALQTVFLKSNRGKDVHKAPPSSMAQKDFNTVRTSGNYERKTGKVYHHEKDRVLSINNRKKKEEYLAHQQLLAQQEAEKCAVEAAAKKKKERMDYTLQEYFDSLLAERGYQIEVLPTLGTAYFSVPSDLQKASYGPRMVQIVKAADYQALEETLSAGLSPNPCNQFGESLLHMACRRGDLKLLEVFIDAGAILQVTDDYGRTILHDACWAAHPCFDVITKILKHDNFLFFMKDKRGALPLSYVHKSDWGQWRDWFDANIDKFYPASHAEIFCPSELAVLPPNSFPVPDGRSDLPLDLVRMIASGDMSPREALIMAEAKASGDDDATVAMTTVASSSRGSLGEDESEFESDYDSDFDSDYDSDDSEFDMEDEAMFEMLHMAGKGGM